MSQTETPSSSGSGTGTAVPRQPQKSTARSTSGSSAGSSANPGSESPQDQGRMSFFQHADELRVRVMRCLYVFFGGFILFFFYTDPILSFLRQPLFDALPPEQRKLYFTHLFENFLLHLKVGGYASLFFLSPYYFSQVWGFIAPGLYPRERKLAIPFIVAASFFFVSGALFAYYVLFPVGFKYFVSFGSPTDIPLLTIDSYYTTALKLMLLFGLGFELPVLISLLGALGVVNSELLARNRRNAIIGITVFAALAAPPDAVSMLLLGTPLVLLYEVSIQVVRVFDRRRAQAAGAAEPGASPAEAPHPWTGQSR